MFFLLIFILIKVKKAYYRLSLLVHPDRVKIDEKNVATEKFQVLSKLYTILTDDNKRALYDNQGIIYDDNDSDCNLSGWLDIWKTIFKPITEQDINKYQKEYVGKREIARNCVKLRKKKDYFIIIYFVLLENRIRFGKTRFKESVFKW